MGMLRCIFHLDVLCSQKPHFFDYHQDYARFVKSVSLSPNRHCCQAVSESGTFLTIASRGKAWIFLRYQHTSSTSVPFHSDKVEYLRSKKTAVS